VDWLLGFERIIIALLALAGISLTTDQSGETTAAGTTVASIEALRLELGHGGSGATIVVFADAGNGLATQRRAPVRASRPLLTPQFD
jgi:hypothetical protein